MAVLISADCVHCVDYRWGNRNYAPFGVDRKGYSKAVDRDLDIAGNTLVGEIDAGAIAEFRSRVERDSLEWPCQVTWCGV